MFSFQCPVCACSTGERTVAGDLIRAHAPTTMTAVPPAQGGIKILATAMVHSSMFPYSSQCLPRLWIHIRASISEASGIISNTFHVKMEFSALFLVLGILSFGVNFCLWSAEKVGLSGR